MNKNEMSLPFVAAIDFDGVLVESAYPEIGKIYNPRGWDALRAILALGGVVVINTARGGQQLREAINYVSAVLVGSNVSTKNLLFNQSHPSWVEYYGPSTKVSADIFVDDRSVEFSPDRWPEYLIRAALQTMETTLEFTPGSFGSKGFHADWSMLRFTKRRLPPGGWASDRVQSYIRSKAPF